MKPRPATVAAMRWRADICGASMRVSIARPGERRGRIKSRCRNKASRDRRQPRIGIRGGLVAATAKQRGRIRSRGPVGQAGTRRRIVSWRTRTRRFAGRERSDRGRIGAAARAVPARRRRRWRARRSTSRISSRTPFPGGRGQACCGGDPRLHSRASGVVTYVIPER